VSGEDQDRRIAVRDRPRVGRFRPTPPAPRTTLTRPEPAAPAGSPPPGAHARTPPRPPPFRAAPPHSGTTPRPHGGTTAQRHGATAARRHGGTGSLSLDTRWTHAGAIPDKGNRPCPGPYFAPADPKVSRHPTAPSSESFGKLLKHFSVVNGADRLFSHRSAF